MTDDTAGYKRPTRDTRFQPGTSGNPRGRPKKSASLKADLAAEMREPIMLRDKSGRAHRVTKQRALVKTLIESALLNEKAAISALLACMRFAGAGVEEANQPSADVEDLEMIKQYLERAERAKKDPPGDPKVSK